LVLWNWFNDDASVIAYDLVKGELVPVRTAVVVNGGDDCEPADAMHCWVRMTRSVRVQNNWGLGFGTMFSPLQRDPPLVMMMVMAMAMVMMGSVHSLYGRG
jgi:hypothetical protein